MNATDLSSILETALKREVEAYDFYMKLFGLVEDKEAKETIKFLAEEEKKHQAFLAKYKESGSGPEYLKLNTVVDYKVAEYLDKPDISGKLNSRDAYLIAAHRELNSYNFYRALANIHPEGPVKELLNKMANEELKHKEKVEYLYSNTAFPQLDGG